ncbi:hypothetical protein [Planomicrobium sp. CPCC 101079]|nr:hypothetical protein [Planomicrobium sp. CPCC 101079]
MIENIWTETQDPNRYFTNKMNNRLKKSYSPFQLLQELFKNRCRKGGEDA